MIQPNNQENKEIGRISFEIDIKLREEWKAKLKARGFSNWKDYFGYLLENDKGDMMIEDTPIMREELRTLKDINKTLLTQVQLLTEQLKSFDYLTQMNTLNKKINNHIKTPKMEMIKENVLHIIEESNIPLTLFTLHEKLNRTDISENELYEALTSLVEQNKINLNFHDQTYVRKGGL